MNWLTLQNFRILPVYFENFQTLVPSLFTDAQKFKTKFEECRKEIEEREKEGPGKNDNAEKVAEKLEALSVREAREEAEEKSEEKQWITLSFSFPFLFKNLPYPLRFVFLFCFYKGLYKELNSNFQVVFLFCFFFNFFFFQVLTPLNMTSEIHSPVMKMYCAFFSIVETLIYSHQK